MENNKLEALAFEIYTWCKEHDLWGDNTIYFSGKALSSSPTWGDNNGGQIFDDLYEYENKNPLDYFEYANPNTLSMSFEGALNHVLNGYVSGWVKLKEEFSNIFKKYGYYYEMGYAWSLSTYKL